MDFCCHFWQYLIYHHLNRMSFDCVIFFTQVSSSHMTWIMTTASEAENISSFIVDKIVSHKVKKSKWFCKEISLYSCMEFYSQRSAKLRWNDGETTEKSPDSLRTIIAISNLKNGVKSANFYGTDSSLWKESYMLPDRHPSTVCNKDELIIWTRNFWLFYKYEKLKMLNEKV